MPLAKRFYDANKPNWPWRAEDMRATIEALEISPYGYVASTGNGFLLGQISPNPFARDWLIASEMLWWSEDGNGLRLARGFRKWARDMGASEIYWSCPPESKANRIFGRWGVHADNNYSELVQCA